ncbi:LysR family transcriptional regulator [Vogesella sp. GCM10023246]|uniref:LysR family transcriptional regulator n=1 Tax=Vogesella oryzagri TaxID=3160864 RepID=A0ABV1M1G8_9NEIS
MNITLRQLRAFLAVSQHGGFGRAGDRVGLTQSAVSRSIRELEEQLGIRLLDRTTREVLLTATGQRLSGQLTRVLDELDSVLAEARQAGEQAKGTVRVASSPTLSASLMPACLAACGQRYPQLQLQLLDQVQRLNLDSVLAGEVDFGLVVDPRAQPELHSERVLSDPFCLVLPPDHPLAAQDSVHWSQLQNASLVLLDGNSGSRPLIEAALAVQGVSAQVVQQLGHSTAVFRVVEAGIGISISPRLALPLPAGSALTVRPLLPEIRRDVMLVRRAGRSLSPLAEKVWQLMREVLAADEPPAAG